MRARETRRCETHHPSQTEALGAELAGELRPGDAVLVQGEMGVGKTTFVRGASRALGVRSVVSSPTFTIGQRYRTAVPVAHVDLFRVESLDREDPELLDDYIGENMIAFVELPLKSSSDQEELEREVARLGRIVARVRLGHAGGDDRVVEIER